MSMQTQEVAKTAPARATASAQIDPQHLRASGYDYSGRVYADIDADRFGSGYQARVWLTGEGVSGWYNVHAWQRLGDRYEGVAYRGDVEIRLRLDLFMDRAEMDVIKTGRSGARRLYQFNLWLR